MICIQQKNQKLPKFHFVYELIYLYSFPYHLDPYIMKKSLTGVLKRCNAITLSATLLCLSTISYAQISGMHDPAKAINAVYTDVNPIISCEDLTKVTIPNAVIESAVADPKGFCLVTVVVNHPPANDHVKVWIALPTKNWNGRFYGTGGGGFVGGLTISLREPVSEGFAAGATNAGHEVFNASFALDADNHHLNWQEIRDFAYLGIHDMTLVGKRLVQAFYGKPARYSYFAGGSNGGRQALTESQRFPEDYDGILSLCPAINWSYILISDLWPQAVMNDAKNLISKAKFDAVNKAMIETCDGLDGVKDGVINDPLHCTWDPKTLVGTTVGESLFSVADADVVRRIWEGPRAHDGKFLWHGMPRSSDLTAQAGTTGTPLKNAPNSLFTDWTKYFLTTDLKWDVSLMNCDAFELLCNQSVEQYGAVFYAENTNLAPFRDHGGKLLIMHGLSDQLINPQGTIEYFKEVEKQMGGDKATSKFVRLYLVPGVNHGFVGAGAGPVGEMDALISWVEKGKIPGVINAELHDMSGKLIRTRPLFPYPQIARYKGTGNTDEAANFVKSLPDK